MLKSIHNLIDRVLHPPTPIDEIQEWIQWRESGIHQTRWSENTKNTYVPYLRKFLNRYKTLSYENVKAWLFNIPQEQHSKRRHNHSALSSFAKLQVEKSRLESSEYEKIKSLYPKRDKYNREKQLIITPQQLETLIKTAGSNQHQYQGLLNRTILILFSETALRASELCNLKLEDLRFSDSENTVGYILIRCGKGGKPGKAPFTLKAQRAVKTYLKHRPHNTSYANVFLGFGPNTGYQPLDRHAVARRFQAISEKTGIPFTSHSLRHFKITEWGKEHPSATVQRLARHNSITITERYLHIQDDEAIAAAFK